MPRMARGRITCSRKFYTDSMDNGHQKYSEGMKYNAQLIISNKLLMVKYLNNIY